MFSSHDMFLGCNGYTCQAEDNALRDIIQKCWVNFILTGNPTPINGGLSFVWPKLDNNNRYLSFLPIPQVSFKNIHDSFSRKLFGICLSGPE